MRMPCACRTSKYGKNVWTSKSGMVSKWPSRNSKDRWDMRREKARWRDMAHVQQTPFSWPWAMRVCDTHEKCANVTVHALCAEKCARNRWVYVRFCEQFVTGPELFFVIMNFIHKTLCFSWYNNVRCVLVFSAQMSNCSPIRRPLLVEVWTVSRQSQYVRSKFSHNYVSAVSSFPGFGSSLHPFSTLLGRRRYQQFHFFWLGHGQNFSVHHATYLSFFFFCQGEMIKPSRHCSVNPELIYRMNCLEQEFCVHSISVEVNGTFAFPLFQDSTTQNTGTFETGCLVSLNRCTILLAVHFHCPFWSWESPYNFSSDPGPRNVQCPCKNFMAQSLTSSAFEMHFSFPLNVVEHWHEDDQVLELLWLGLPFLQVLLDFLKNRQWWKPWESCPLKFNCLSIDTHCILVRRIQPERHSTWPSHVSIASGVSLSNTYNGISMDTYFASLPIWSLDHWLIPILPMKVMNTPGISHSDLFQKVPLTTSE